MRKEPTMKKIATIIAAATATALALALTGCGQQAEQQSPEPSTGIKIEVQAESWDAEQSTPVILVLTPEAEATEEGADPAEEPTPIVSAIPANETAAIEVEAGTYALDLVSPINADGSIYKVPEGTEVEVVEGELDDSEAIELELIPAEQATSNQVTAIVSALTIALADQAGVPDADAILERARANAKSNPNVTEEAIQAAKDEAEQAVESGSASVAGAAQTSGNAGQQASGSAGSGSSSSAPSQAAPAPSAPSHTHSFQPHYYTTQVLVGRHYVCYACNKTVSDPAAHQEEAGPGSSHPCGTEPIWQSQQLIDYYYCSCGATQ